MSEPLASIILAAGLGTRMRSARAKVLHELAGEPMIARALRAHAEAGASPLIVVVGHQAHLVEEAARRAGVSSELVFASQADQRGTGDAARCGIEKLDPAFHGDVLISYADMPAVRAATLRAFVEAHRKSNASLSIISVNLGNPGAYGRVMRDRDGNVTAIVEARDANTEQREINEINAGVYLANADFLSSALTKIQPNNAQREYYLTDVVALARQSGLKVGSYLSDEPGEFAGINSREELAQMETEIRNEINRKLMESGVTLVDPATAYIGSQVEIGADTVIGPNVQILGRSRIGSGVKIEGTAWLSNVNVGDGSHLKLGVRAEDCLIGPDCEIGPFANLRAGTELEGHNRVGNFVETKKARLGRGTKASHLSYLGDAVIGRETNVGCGVITVNYDGYEKHLTEIGDRCMVGCDSQLVAPVKVGNDVYVASGTTIVREVSDGALVMSHHPQREKPGWTEQWHQRHAGRNSKSSK
jgi:bifunctional UDP-N-acetylglucosamine pyrophosphorylase/glucosamine-1-phosphate N-acetyltransferase